MLGPSGSGLGEGSGARVGPLIPPWTWALTLLFLATWLAACRLWLPMAFSGRSLEDPCPLPPSRPVMAFTHPVLLAAEPALSAIQFGFIYSKQPTPARPPTAESLRSDL